MPPAWRNVEEVIRDENGKEIGRRPFSLPIWGIGETGYPLSSYHAKTPEDRMTRFLKWNFEPLLEQTSPAMAGPLRCGNNDRAMFPQQVKRVDLSSWFWPELPSWSQKLIAVEKFDPGVQKRLLGHGAHMPVMGFIGRTSRRSPEAQKARAEKADRRGWTAERRHPERRTSGWGHRGGWGAAWQGAWPSTRGGGGSTGSGSWQGGAAWQEAWSSTRGGGGSSASGSWQGDWQNWW